MTIFKLSEVIIKLRTIITRPLASSTTMTASSKLNELRELMKKNNLAAYYVPSEDSHQVNLRGLFIFYISVE